MNKACFTQTPDGSIQISTQQPFTHRHHLELAFYLLKRYDFFEATHLFARAIRVLVEAVGARDKFHCTITLAHLAIVAERMSSNAYPDFESFLINNQDLLNKKLLHQWYSARQLNSTTARKIFVLPLTA